MVVPVHERALGVAAPRPNVEFEERLYGVAVRGVDVQKHLALENGGRGMSLQPGRCIHDKLHADELQITVWQGLIDQGLRLRSFNGSVQQTPVDVVNAHGSMVRAAYTAE